jgi:hypothetical protein
MNTIQYIPSDSQNEMATISTLNSLPTLYGRQRRPPSYLTNNYYHGELRTNKLKNTNLKSVLKAKRKVVMKTKQVQKRTQKVQKLRDDFDDEQEEGLVSFDEEIEQEEIYKPKSGYIWQYLDGSFQNYDLQGSENVEEVYQQWVKNPGDFDVRSVQSGQFSYMVDFRKMTQMNIVHENHTIRQVRRIECK